MWFPAGILALVLAVQVIDTRACSPRAQEPAPAPSPSPAPAPSADVFTTADGIRF
jgi:hypothetical protein